MRLNTIEKYRIDIQPLQCNYEIKQEAKTLSKYIKLIGTTYISLIHSFLNHLLLSSHAALSNNTRR